MAKNKEQLITQYKNNLMKVESEWSSHGERGQEYIDYAKGQLEAVEKNGMDGLKEFWDEHKK